MGVVFPRNLERSIASRYLYALGGGSNGNANLTQQDNLLISLLKKLFHPQHRPTSWFLMVVSFLVSAVSIIFIFKGKIHSLTGVSILLGCMLLGCTTLFLRIFSALSTIAIMGITAGTTALLTILFATGGMIDSFSTSYTDIMGHIFVIDNSMADTHPRWASDLRADPAIRSVSPTVLEPMLITTSQGHSGFSLVKGFDPKNIPFSKTLARAFPLPLSTLNELNTQQGTPLPKAFVGSELAKQLHLQPGNSFRLTSATAFLRNRVPPAPDPSSALAPLLEQEFVMAATLDSGIFTIDNQLVLVALPYAQRLRGQGDEISGFDVFLHPGQSLEKGVFSISNKLGYAGEPRSWKDINKNLLSTLELQRAVLSSVMFLIVLVGAFNIIASLTMLVSEKTKEIAILKAIGLSPRRCARIFRIIGIRLGLIGVLSGTALALWFCKVLEYVHLPLNGKIYQVNHLPIRWQWPQAVGVSILVMAICFLTAVSAARRAARLQPVDGLRYDE